MIRLMYTLSYTCICRNFVSNRSDIEPLITFTLLFIKSSIWDSLLYHHRDVESNKCSISSSKTLGNILRYKATCFAQLPHKFVKEKSWKYRILLILVPKGVLNDDSSHFIDCAHKSKTFANILTKSQRL